MNTALLLVDIQNDYFHGGMMVLEGSLEAATNAAKILSSFRMKGLPVVHIQHVSAHPQATFFVSGTAGVEIHESVRPEPGETIFRKRFPNSFRDTPLLEHLRQLDIEKVVICGMMTHMCVDATVRAAFDHGFRCVLIHDACATRSLSFKDELIPASHVHGSFIAALAGLYAGTVDAETYLSEAASL
jgi:nicotinamidase-related amidase